MYDVRRRQLHVDRRFKRARQLRKRILADPPAKRTVRQTTQRINFKNTTYLCVLASSVWRRHDTWLTRTAIRKTERKKDSIKVHCGGQKKSLHQSDTAPTSSDHTTRSGQRSRRPSGPDRRSVPIRSIIDLSRPQPRPRRSEIEQAPFWILDDRPVLVRPENVNECPQTVNCDVNAYCSDTPGSFVCSCKAGFSGDGRSCEGKVDVNWW